MSELEQEAVTMVREYKKWLVVAPKLKVFLLKLAGHLGWHDLKGELDGPKRL